MITANPIKNITNSKLKEKSQLFRKVKSHSYTDYNTFSKRAQLSGTYFIKKEEAVSFLLVLFSSKEKKGSMSNNKVFCNTICDV